MKNLIAAYNSLQSDIISILDVSSISEVESGNFIRGLESENHALLLDVFHPALKRSSADLCSYTAQLIAVSDMSEMLDKCGAS